MAAGLEGERTVAPPTPVCHTVHGPLTGERGAATQRLELDPNALVFSYEHQVLVEGD
jgi:hypothetical protein